MIFNRHPQNVANLSLRIGSGAREGAFGDWRVGFDPPTWGILFPWSPPTTGRTFGVVVDGNMWQF